MKKQSKHHIHSLTVRITAIAIIPLCILACILTIIGIGSIRSGGGINIAGIDDGSAGNVRCAE